MKTLQIEKGDILNFSYVNYKDEKSYRKVVVDNIYLGSNKWHPEPQFLLMALDVDKNAMRAFAMKDMSEIIIMKNRW